jgi:hypothetical protein
LLDLARTEAWLEGRLADDPRPAQEVRVRVSR